MSRVVKVLLARWLGAALDDRVAGLKQRARRADARADRLQVHVDELAAAYAQLRAAADATLRRNEALTEERDRLAVLLDEHRPAATEVPS